MVVLSFGSPVSIGAEAMVSFDTPEQESLYKILLQEYRCLKCQNQNLADSNAGLATDLRREIRTQVMAGKKKNQIDDYLVSRYGEFVLYRPRFSSKTLVLWILPFVLFVAAIAGLVISGQRRKRSALDALPESPDSDQIKAARRYLENP